MNIFFLHAGFMTAGFLMMGTGVAAALFMKKHRWWLKFHKAAGLTGVFSLIIGITAAVIMVEGSAGSHFQVLHARLGVMTSFLALVTPVLGLLQFRLKDKTRQIRLMHRWAGRIMLTLALVTIISGLFTAGII